MIFRLKTSLTDRLAGYQSKGHKVKAAILSIVVHNNVYKSMCLSPYFSNVTLLDRLNKVPGFPADILPQVVAPGTVVGKLKSNWHGINEGTRVQVALGDLQCSVLSCEPKMNEAGLAGVFC